MEQQEIIKEINKKYNSIGENPDKYLLKVLYEKPLTYWDYIETETLLTLQKPRTDYKDEEIFIMYHQITELTLKMILHEIKQIISDDRLEEDTFVMHMKRICRYVHMLITSFDIMKTGMYYEHFNAFRMALGSASGFQCIQFRYIEIYSTSLKNLIHAENKNTDEMSFKQCIENLYWRKPGENKSITVRSFEEKYMEELTVLAEKLTGRSIYDRFKKIHQPSEELIAVLKKFDRLYNVDWPNVHLSTAKHYLNNKGEHKAATGGSDWKKYLDPINQKRIFFPDLWTKQEKMNWGN